MAETGRSREVATLGCGHGIVRGDPKVIPSGSWPVGQMTSAPFIRRGLDEFGWIRASSALVRLRSAVVLSARFPRGVFSGHRTVRLRDATMGGAPSIFSVSWPRAPRGPYELPKLAIPMPEDGEPFPSPTLGRLKK